MPRLIDADALWDATKDTDNVGYMAAMILTAPTIDAVPVVRCKDCSKRYTSMCKARHEQADMDYCSHGQQKEAER